MPAAAQMALLASGATSGPTVNVLEALPSRLTLFHHHHYIWGFTTGPGLHKEVPGVGTCLDDHLSIVPRTEPGTQQALNKCCVNKRIGPT